VGREPGGTSGQQRVVEMRSDGELIAGSCDDPKLYAAIFDRHAGTVFRFLIRRVGRDTADELLGETFRIAFERRSSFDTTRPDARPWLYGIATHLVARHRRTEARRLKATARLVLDAPADSVAEGVADAVDAGAAWPLVVEAIAELPDGERDALLLLVWEELSYEDIALALEIPVGTVRSRLNRARGRLRELMGATGQQQGNRSDDRCRIQS
jgi:RNA polymerase sigma factor (sigma-70 family)